MVISNQLLKFFTSLLSYTIISITCAIYCRCLLALMFHYLTIISFFWRPSILVGSLMNEGNWNMQIDVCLFNFKSHSLVNPSFCKPCVVVNIFLVAFGLVSTLVALLYSCCYVVLVCPGVAFCLFIFASLCFNSKKIMWHVHRLHHSKFIYHKHMVRMSISIFST